ncbi:hypothetical protein [Cohnella candidum]|uniref:Uncharacterized protein n=1 Tax=Cohnella candidum TaxID=2674991 RepID=A0A3G3JV34_9BACL|nr:hypothetical protein [Cohnella candidum]AYQ72113.1 hypothetical protein EAV92_05725 [Cohnella candidum]
MLLWLTTLFFLSTALLGLVDLLTFKPNPVGHMSGNGNPALLAIFVFVPAYLAFVLLLGILSFLFFRSGFRSGKLFAEWIIIAFFGGCLLVWLVKMHAQGIFYTLGGKPSDPDSLITGWSMFNQYTNMVYFNYLTYSLGMLVSILIGYFAALAIWYDSRKSGNRKE